MPQDKRHATIILASLNRFYNNPPPMVKEIVVKNIIFDWSGTIADDLRQVWRATNVALVGCGGSAISLARFRREFCLPFRPFYRRHLPGVPQPKIDKFFFGDLVNVQPSIGLLPHASGFLRYCQRSGIRTYVVTTVKTPHFLEQARRLGVAPFLTATLSGVRDKRRAIRRFFRETKMKPRETLFVGDMSHDIETARVAGCHACAVLTGFNFRDELIAAQPDFLVKNLSDLRKQLNHATL